MSISRPPGTPVFVAFRRNWRILRSALALRDDPTAFYRELAGTTIDYLQAMSVPLSGRRWLDVGTGGGATPEILAGAGALAVAVDIQDLRSDHVDRSPFALAQAQRLPFEDGQFDGVVSSNVLEHTNDPFGMLQELARVCRPDGYIYVSWTNWLSPWGGHEMTPWHYLGPRLGLLMYKALHGRPPAQNVSGQNLFAVHVGTILRALRRFPELRTVDVAPRYWPSLRFVARIPGVREVALGNCVVLLRKRGSRAGVSVGNGQGSPTRRRPVPSPR